MGKASFDRTKEIYDYAQKYGKNDACIHFGLAYETVKRYCTRYKTENGEVIKRSAENIQITKILERYSQEELKALADGKSINPQIQKTKIHFSGDEIVIGFCTDTHFGSKYSPPHYWESFLEECDKVGVDYIMHGGDLIEGMSNRPDHVYQLDHIGFSAQMDYAEERLSMTDLPIYIIDGNHDRWGIKSNGIFAVRDVAARLPHVTFMGHDTGDIDINGTVWRLWHGEDGNSYAISYRLQKIVESIRGGEKPHVLLCGHTHKQGYFFERNVHVVSGGALSTQTPWMRGKRIANYDGFHIIRACIADGEVKWFELRWYPFY